MNVAISYPMNRPTLVIKTNKKRFVFKEGQELKKDDLKLIYELLMAYSKEK